MTLPAPADRLARSAGAVLRRLRTAADNDQGRLPPVCGAADLS